MTIEEFAEIFYKFAFPFLLFVTPIALVLVYLAPNPPEDHLGLGTYAIITIIGVAITIGSFIYCRNKLGWFGGNNK